MSDDPIYISRELREEEFYILSLQGEDAIREYGLLHLLDRGYIRSKEEYGGSYLHRCDDKYKLMSIIASNDKVHKLNQDNPFEDDLK